MSTKLTKLCCFKCDNSAVLTLSKIARANNCADIVNISRTEKHRNREHFYSSEFCLLPFMLSFNLV